MNVFVARKRPISLKRMIQSSFALGALPSSVLGNGNRHLGPGRVDEAEGVPVPVDVHQRLQIPGPSAQNSPTMSLIGGRRPFSTRSSTSALRSLSEKDRVHRVLHVGLHMGTSLHRLHMLKSEFDLEGPFRRINVLHFPPTACMHALFPLVVLRGPCEH